MTTFVLFLAMFAGPKKGVTATIPVPCDSSNPQTVTVQLPQAWPGRPYSVTFQATSGMPPFTFHWAGGSIPDGLEFYNDGRIQGVPSSSITTSFTIECTDGNLG